jgi:putative hydrolase of the HAD superfamily
MDKEPSIALVLFDFGGVLAEEGFRDGLLAIAEKNGREKQQFLNEVTGLILSSGYLTGQAQETSFWDAMRKKTGIPGSDQELRSEILSRFAIRDWMPVLVRQLRSKSIQTAILSDQTNWLDELEARHDFFKYFDRVFNSYHLHKSKHDPSVFDDVLRVMRVQPDRALFIDDTAGHVRRAEGRGLQAILYHAEAELRRALGKYFPLLPAA